MVKSHDRNFYEKMVKLYMMIAATTKQKNVEQPMTSFDDKESNYENFRVLNRLIIQKILASDSSRYLKKVSFETLNRLFISDLSETIDLSLGYKTINPDDRNDQYYEHVLDMNMRWIKNKEIIDKEGNVWVTHQFETTFNITNAFKASSQKFEDKLDVLNAVSHLKKELHELVPYPMRIMTLDNAGRLNRDNEALHRQFLRDAQDFLSKNKIIWTGLRVHGKTKEIKREESFLIDVKPGKYNVSFNIGSQKRPKFRVFSFKIEIDEKLPAIIQRIR